MNREIVATALALLAVLSIAWGIWDFSKPYGRGEVSVMLHGVGLFLGLFLGSVFATLAVWTAFWHVLWARRLGTVVVVGGALFLGSSIVTMFWSDWTRSWDRMRGIQAGYTHLHEVSEATIATLVTDSPQGPEAIALGETLRAAIYRDVYAGLMLADPEYQRARRIWTLYLAVFLDQADPMRDPIAPIAADCAEFQTLFAAQYDPALHRDRFAAMCD